MPFDNVLVLSLPDRWINVAVCCDHVESIATKSLFLCTDEFVNGHIKAGGEIFTAGCCQIQLMWRPASSKAMLFRIRASSHGLSNCPFGKLLHCRFALKALSSPTNSYN